MEKIPLVSLIVVNFNGKKWIKGCIDSLLKQSYKNLEIFFVDNGSSDESATFVKQKFKKVNVLEAKENLGFAGGNNLAIKKSKGKFLILLNNDTTVPYDYVEKMVKAFDEIPNLGIAQSMIVLMSDKKTIDSCGSYWTDLTFLYHYGNGKTKKLLKYNSPLPVFSVKGASMIIKREVIEMMGGFDDDFWCYYEETDLCQRAWMAGFECWYYPKIFVYHGVGGTSLKLNFKYVQYHNFKNKLLSILKNFEPQRLVYILPLFLSLNLAISFIWLLQGKFGFFLSIYKAIFWNIGHLSKTLKKRKMLQSKRVVSDDKILKICKVNPDPSFYIHLFHDEMKKYKDKDLTKIFKTTHAK